MLAHKQQSLKQVLKPSDQSTVKSAVIVKPSLLRLYVIQMITLVLVTGICAIGDLVLAYSVFLGGMIAVLPSAYFARQAFRYRGAKSAHLVSRAFYWGEAGKFLATGFLFASAFILVRPIDSVALMTAYVATLVYNWGLLFYRLR